MCVITSKDRLLDIFFPPRCAICDIVIPMGQGHICQDCRKKLTYLKDPVCLKCGKEISSAEEEYCLDCKKRNRTYDKGFPVFNYVPPVRDAIMAFKYQGRQEYAIFYAEEIYSRYGQEFKRLGVEALIPVPVHRNKLVTRGYNQAQLIAVELSKLTGIKLRTDLLQRTEFTMPQKELSDDERDKNMRKAFKGGYAIESEISLKRVLLVDDIYTTGSTIEACTRILKAMGVENVYYTSVAIGKV